MEKSIVIGCIWLMAIVCLVLFVRGASSSRRRASAMARSREDRRRSAALEDQAESTAKPEGT